MAPPATWAGAEEWAGRRIGPYSIVRELGRGGMGAVYLAERADGQYQHRVALKLIKRGMDTEQVLTRFRSERQILASLDHPNIARLLDGGSTDQGLPFFAMEYIDGEPIDTYAGRAGLSVEDGIVVDDHLRTSHPDVFTACDSSCRCAARWPMPIRTWSSIVTSSR